MENPTQYEVIPAQRYDMTSDAMTPDTVMRQVTLIQEVMRKAMHSGEHYGPIPGCGPKPTLLKPGAEKLSLTFRLSPAYEIKERDLSNGHRQYQVLCTLTHIPTGLIFGQGVGMCSTMEGKYRYRTGEIEFIGKEVPKEYWKERDINLIGGKGFNTKKNPDTGKWEIVRQGEKAEHDNPADYYNTCLKMAKKRAHVDAILTVTAASDIFTQDIEDMSETINGEAELPLEGSEDAPQSTKSTKATFVVSVENGKTDFSGRINCPEQIDGESNPRSILKVACKSCIKQKGCPMWQKSPQTAQNTTKAVAASQNDDKDPIRSQYIRLKGTGFKTWVESHLRYIPDMDQKYQDEICAKWLKFYPHLDYPLASKPETEQRPEPEPASENESNEESEKPAQEEQGSTPIALDEERVLSLVELAQRDSWGRLAIPCPDVGYRHVYSGKCKKCELRKGCPAWTAYDKEINEGA